MDIQLGDIRINQLLGNSGIFIGNNQAGQWRSMLKTNEGFGCICGKENYLIAHRHIVYDNDGVDFVIPGKNQAS